MAENVHPAGDRTMGPGWPVRTGPVAAETAARQDAAPESTIPALKTALICTVVAAVYLLARHLMAGADYVGSDNDDIMRLIEVRDLLAGQGWFDMHQYRLGLAGGTLMHWSRLVDLPIAALIAVFSLFSARETAEAAALAVWPTLTLFPLFAGLAIAGLKMGGRVAMIVAPALCGLYIVGIGRFQPGAIDHHNVQMALMVLIAAMLVDRAYATRCFMFAGILCAIAVAIGAETTPHVAIFGAIVAFLWAWHGAPMNRAARAFALSFAGTLGAAFYLTVPPARYSAVTCDALSNGFYVLGTLGGALLFFTAVGLSARSRAVRFAGLGGCAFAIVLAARIVAPQCLASPLAGLDPMVVRLWLDNVTEAQSVLSLAHHRPLLLMTFYTVPLFALSACLFRARSNDRRQSHLIFAALIGVAFMIALVQVRGSPFAILFSFVPLACLIADLRNRAAADSRSKRASVAFVAATLAAVPTVWAIAASGVAVAIGNDDPGFGSSGSAACESPAALSALSHQPAGTVSAVSNLGANILRFTPHRVLSAPYHRNQAGILAQFHIAMADPDAARGLLASNDVAYVAFCPGDVETREMIETAPNGLYATLAAGRIPPYLEALLASGESTEDASLAVYRVLP